MKTKIGSRPGYEFCYPRVDTLILVEKADDEVVIRATRDTFNEEQKLAFIHGLAAEGFIPDEYERCVAIGSAHGVRWRIDCSWLAISGAVLARSRWFMTRLLVSVGVLWAGMMTVLFWAYGS
jgi:hypothetical protein